MAYSAGMKSTLTVIFFLWATGADSAYSADRKDILAVPHLEIEGESEPRDHRISLEQGVELVERYQERHPGAIQAALFDRVIFDDILAQPESAGLRMYNAEKTNGETTLVVVGVDARNHDLLQEKFLGDHGWPCPPACSPAGSLGSSSLADGEGAASHVESSRPRRLEINGEKRDHRISLEQGFALIERHRKQHPGSIQSFTFDRSIFADILAQPGCVGVRMYYAQEADGAPTLVLAGINAQGKDLNILGDDAVRCPSTCPDPPSDPE